MRICGVELRGSKAILALLETDGEWTSYIPTKQRKIELEEDECSDSIRAFFVAFNQFVEAHEIDVVAIKKRNKKGSFAGGPISFKMEALIQLCDVDVALYAPAAVASIQKKENYTVPDTLKKYQHQAYWTACTAHAKTST